MGLVAMNLAPTLRIGAAVGRQGEPANDDQGEPFPERGRGVSSSMLSCESRSSCGASTESPPRCDPDWPRRSC